MVTLTNDSAARPGSLEARIVQARSELAEGRPDAAVQIAARALESYPESGEALAVLGDAYAAKEDWGLAIDYYEQALERTFEPAVMERLATARRRAIRLEQPDEPPPSMTTRGAAQPVRTGRTKAPPYLVAAVVAGVLLIPLLAAFLLRTANGDSTDVALDAPRSAALAAAAGGSALPGTYIDQPVQPSPRSPAPAPTAAKALGTAAPAARTTLRREQTRTQRPSYTRSAARQSGGERAVASARDKKIMAQLQLHRVGAGQSRARATAMALDDYSGLGILTITARPTLDLAQLESDVLQAAYSAAVGAVRTDKGIKTLVVRCLSRMPNEDGEYDDIVLFRGAVTAPSLKPWIDNNRTPSAQQISNDIFRDVWWDQQAIKRYAADLAAKKRNGQ